MKRYKKRTLALVLASVITVVGAFGAENYKNDLMSLGFRNDSSGNVTLSIYTSNSLTNVVKPIQRDNYTYEVLLPETNSKLSSDLPLGRNIASIDVKTLPYTQSSIGYTKITIIMQTPKPLFLETSVYIPDKTAPTPQLETKNLDFNEPPLEKYTESSRHISDDENVEKKVISQDKVDIKDSVKQFESAAKTSPTINNTVAEDLPASNNNEILKFILGGLLVFVILIYMFLHARAKMVEVTGEQLDLNLDDEKSVKKNKQQKGKVKSTIKKLDNTYKNSFSMPVPQAMQEQEYDNEIEVHNVIDLDELLEEQNLQKDNNVSADVVIDDADENMALEEFLNAYNYDEEQNAEEIEDNSFDEELYEKYIHDNNLRFTKGDIENISLLMKNEISDEVLNNPEKYMTSVIKNVKPSPTTILENFVTSYTVNQNITFSKADIEALRALMNVELDQDFITNLKIDPARRNEMLEKFEQQTMRPHKTSELLTLNVKDLLPDLSEALKKQGGKKIESEAKPQVVYYSQGYDVATLKLENDILPDLSKEISNESAYETRPSDEIELVDKSFDLQTMVVKDELPDLEDALKNPEKYETSSQTSDEVDEEALLKNIMNVTFKPFDEEREYEILNDADKNVEVNIPTMSDIQDEFKQFDNNFEIIEEEELINQLESDEDDFAALYDTNYVDLDSENPADGIDFVEAKKSDAQKLLDQIKNAEMLRKLKVENQQTSSKQNKIEKIKKEENVPSKPEFCILEGERYSIVSVNYFTDKMGCYLAKSEKGFCVIGFIGDKIYKIKTYELLETENMQSRISKKLGNGASRYIVRIGIHKFILNVDNDNMEFVMDLC